MRVIYFCTSPKSGEHAGGVKVIYNHSLQLNSLGVESFVLHERKGYHYRWIEHKAPMISDSELRSTDHLIVPEIKAAALARRLVSNQFRYSVFVQNGHYLGEHDGSCLDIDIDFAYQHALRILSISSDTSALITLCYPGLSDRIIRVACAVDATWFHAGDKKDALITYMPRKNRRHTTAVDLHLKKVFAAKLAHSSDRRIIRDTGCKRASAVAYLPVFFRFGRAWTASHRSGLMRQLCNRLSWWGWQRILAVAQL